MKKPISEAKFSKAARRKSKRIGRTFVELDEENKIHHRDMADFLFRSPPKKKDA